MVSIASELASLLSTVRRPGDFFVSGTVEHVAPRLEVDGVGVVALPLLPMQAEQLVAVAERAPYGRGAETVIDTDVRRTWQIGADKVRIGGKHWTSTLDAILARVGEGLGVSEPIAAELYKLLVYDQGSFFVCHRDTEKAPGMFATLVIVLPSVSTGGELVVRHKGREARIDLRCEEPSEASFAAFYADCVHEVLPVTAGCRLNLVYNLRRRGKGPTPKPPSYAGEQERATALLQAWAAGKGSPADETPEKLIYPLEHAYTSAELGFATLKGVDAAVAGVLVAAAKQSSCDVHLALLTIEESGAAEYVDDYGSRRGRWSEPDLEAGEIFERHVALSEWRRPDGSASALGELPVEDNELSPPDAFEEMEPDDEEFHEAAGNEGASFDRTYRRAALVLWPRERMLAVLSQAGLAVTLPYLSDLTERWIASAENGRSPLWDEAHELSGHMLSKWPKQRWSRPHDQAPSDASRVLALMIRLRDTARLDEFLAEIAPSGLHDKRDNDAIVGALDLLSPDRAVALLQRIIAGTAATSLAACGDLLVRAITAMPRSRRADLVGAATVLVDALPGDPARAAARQPWQCPIAVEPGFILDLFTALEQIDEALADRVAHYVLAWPKTYDLDDVLVPAVRQLTESLGSKGSAAVQRLRRVCIEHLRARAAEPLEAPKDWTRTSTLSCRCPHCRELAGYLADPEHKTWVFKTAEPNRRHLEATIRQARCDLDVTTERRGSPHSLVCTKNQASYERRKKQRKSDLENLAALDPG
jgi:hypothetical protein